jgi:hypothetical protein
MYLEKKRVINRGDVCCVQKYRKKESVIKILIMYLACVLANTKESLIREN